MQPLVTGIHHVTAFAGEPVRHLRFYTEILGFELVKRTVNFDAPSMWHLYYGQALGAPGTLLTSFPEPQAARARHGGGEISSVTMAVRAGGLAVLGARLGASGLASSRHRLLGRDVLTFEDPDGMPISAEERDDPQQPSAPSEVARVALDVPSAAETCGFLREIMGFSEHARGDGVVRLALGEGGSGRELDVVDAPGRDPQPLAAGTIHHVAWRVSDLHAQRRAAEALLAARVAVTPVRDRHYFHSIYFRIPGGVLFEIATDGPGFTVDEPADRLGSELRLPPRYGPHRARIEAELPSLTHPSA